MKRDRAQPRAQAHQPWRLVSTPPTTSTRPRPGLMIVAAGGGGMVGLISGAYVSGAMISTSGIGATHRVMAPEDVVGGWMLGGIASAIFGGTCFGSWVIRRFFAPCSRVAERRSGAAGLPLRGRWLICFVFAITAFLISPAMIIGLGVWLTAR